MLICSTSRGVSSCFVGMLVLVASCLSHAGVVTYRLEVDNTWSTTTHPGLFPDAAHFSWLGGGTHNAQVNFWSEGQLASPGIVEMAESGRVDLLENEVDAAIVSGTAWSSPAWRWWFCPGETSNGSCGVTTVEFDMDSRFPLITLATMLGPSPDWFVGVDGLSLRTNGQWLSSLIVDLFPYDGGTRSANSWNLGGPLNNPPEPISLITQETGQLVGPASLGTMTFTLLTVPSGVGSEPDRLDASIGLHQNWPNPVRGGTNIVFRLPRDSAVELSIYNVQGRQVAQLFEGLRSAGANQLWWDGRNAAGDRLAEGIYFYRLQANGQAETKKLLLLR